MSVLVACASRYGATKGIAAHIAETLRASGLKVDLEPIETVRRVDAYDAFVIGSAVYIGSWQKSAAEFVRRNRDVLALKPVWLFSSGPLGTNPVNKDGVDQKVSAQPKEIVEFETAIRPRGDRVFFGAFHREGLGLRDALIAKMPAGRDLLPEGDFRDWADVEAWAREIAGQLQPALA